MGILSILLSLTLLMALAYRGISVLILAPLCALLAVVFSPGVPLLASYTQVFMPALGAFVVAFFPLFLLGAVFGKLMEASGAAHRIATAIVDVLGARQAVLAVVLACAVLTYGGVSLFVVAFAVYPIAQALFRQADIPRRLIPATISLGAFTFTMTALPGTPSIQNAIPMPYFGTTPFAAPGLGLIGGGVMLLLGWLWLVYRVRQARALGEHHDAIDVGDSSSLMPSRGPVHQTEMSTWLALSPVVMVVLLNFLLSTWFWQSIDTTYLAQPRYGATTLAAVRGIWSVVLALALSILWLLWLHRQRLGQLKDVLEAGAISSVAPLLNTASQVGYGAVIASLAGFALIRDAVLDLAPGNPLVSISVAVNILAGVTGSASGGMSIALQTLGDTWLEMGRSVGIAPELLHRVTAIATGGLDALPHNGAVITLLGICQLGHKQAYKDIFVVAVAGPLVALVIVVALGSVFGAF